MSLTTRERLTPTQRVILAHLEEHGTISDKDIREMCHSAILGTYRLGSNVANVHIMNLRKAMPELKIERVRGNVVADGYWKLEATTV